MSSQTFLIIGATGTQGSSVVKALLKQPTSTPFTILALTRDVKSQRAQSIAALDSRITLIAGDPDSPEAIFETSTRPITAVFCVTLHRAQGGEEAQAKGIIDASLSHGVKHFVFTSADRGGDVVSDTTATSVPHIASKYKIEQYLKEKTKDSPMAWTILRPVTFMDNLTPDFAGKGFAAMWRQIGSRPIQVVAASDIGVFAAKALLEPERFDGKSVGIAGDTLNYEEACKVFKEKMGMEMPTAIGVVGTMVKYVMKDIGAMFKWFETEGFGVDIPAARKENPDLQDFGTWLEKSSSFKGLKVGGKS